MNLLVKWWRLTAADQQLVVKMAIVLGMIRVGLKIFSFNKLKNILESTSRSSPDLQPVDGEYQQKVVWAATSVGRRVLSDQPCLAQALAVQLFFKRKNIPAKLYIGVAKENDGQLTAHAWVESDGQVVIGGSQQDLNRYTRLPAIDGKQI